MEWFIAHLFGDFVLQNDWMAKGKKTSSWICTVHIVVYMFPFFLLQLQWWQYLLIAIQHWIQDKTYVIQWYMNAMGKKDFTRPPFTPWSIIIVDSVWHLIWLYMVIEVGSKYA